MNILIAEDHQPIRDGLQELLQAAGHDCWAARHGREAWALFQQHAPDFCLLDVMMPEMDGLEATRRIREEPRWRELPIVALTANAGLEDRQRCLGAGMNDVLTKPFEIADLHRVLKEHAVATGALDV